MTPFSVRLTVALVALLPATVTFAQGGDWYVAPSIVFNNDDPYRAVDDSLSGIQISGGRALTDHISLEGILGYSSIDAETCAPGDCFPKQQHLDVGVNALFFYDREMRFSPYLLVGGGYLNVSADTGTQFNRDTGETAATASAGVGLLWRLGDGNWSVRAEYRNRVAFDDNELLDRVITLGMH